ncbi:MULTISPECIES: hypothetical protein [Streptomyces]|jgi:hypothetical protein|uniref:Uncharacterized protein n=1 Tax=Streptomyces doudnae TaxID=3075536 RepID=A0ABD5EZS7_9ACTN|nr:MULTISPECIES: hypothetical protein [unclassified Streptomyces]MDT0439743.1 hypothetical protein [Streptomyces sp. DSM 41981]MYQ68046.1 hypothetical protein [Streptomyces sp. SID4950]SCE42537.1 hypothetical protein GA0115242_13674 [Streptomyces sp. SolWspMP-5a-2]
MGIFGKRRSREERAAELAEKVVSGKGFYGRTTRAFLGNEDFARVQQSMAAYNSGVTAQQLLAAGAPTLTVTVVSLADTGKLVNFDPVVDLVLRPAGAGAEPIALQTIVSKLRIPRPGDQVLLVADPARPGAYLYAGDGTTA